MRKKELRKAPHPRSLETIKALSIFRGSSQGVKYVTISTRQKNLNILFVTHYSKSME